MTRIQKSNEIKNKFICPKKVVVHWDGKTLTLRGRLESKRVCVYVSGVEEDWMRKLFGIPETNSARGEDELKVIRCLTPPPPTVENTPGPASTWKSGWSILSCGWHAGSTCRSCTSGWR